MLMKLFQSLTDRVRALFVADVALDFEAELIRRQAERKHRLLEQADDFHERGYKTVAADLRQQDNKRADHNPHRHRAAADSRTQPEHRAVVDTGWNGSRWRQWF